MKTEILKGNNPLAMIEKDWNVSVYTWSKITNLNSLDELEEFKNSVKTKIVFILPFSLAGRENGHTYIWEEPILAMDVKEELQFARKELMKLLPDIELCVQDIIPSISDDDFEQMVIKFKQEIYAWNICQGIIWRDFNVDVWWISDEEIFTMYRKLLLMRWGYMTYLFDTWNDVFLWASPERHLTVQGDRVIKNPIAWTMLKKPNTFVSDLEAFLQNKKEENELSMVTDEELKMMMKITRWWTISWLILREIWKVIHTEFELKWHKKQLVNVIDCLKNTLYSPTIVWWPLKSAFKYITMYEKVSRWYYGSAFGIFDWDDMDTCIPIRAARVNKQAWTLSVRAWAWIVEDSDPVSEVNETRNKAEWFLWILWKNTSWNTDIYLDKFCEKEKQKINNILLSRQANLAKVYLENIENTDLIVPEIVWKKFILINNWDDFVYMIAHLIEKMWWVCKIVENVDYDNSKNFDFTLIWPWPWNINDETDPKMKKVLEVTKNLRVNWEKVIWICLWHQALCKDIWFEIVHQGKIRQGKQEEIEIFWTKQTVAFYNSFSPVLPSCYTDLVLQSSLKRHDFWLYDDNRLLYQKTDNTVSVQFHPESIMTINGYEILKEMILKII